MPSPETTTSTTNPTPAPATPPPPTDDDPSSSEYETDSDAEPEEFYITLDLTIPAPVQAGPSTNPYVNAGNGPHKSTPMLGASRQQHPTARALPKWARGQSARRDRLQILGLESDSVLINFQNRIWGGTWTSAIGTELYVSGQSGGGEEHEEEEEVVVVDGASALDPPRISGGGYYYSEKDFSLAAAYVGGRRGTHSTKLQQAEGVLGSVVLDPGAGRVLAVGRERVHCLPAVVKAKEWSFAEQLAGKSDFLRRLESIQIAKGELEEINTEFQRRRRRRRRAKVVVEGEAGEAGETGEAVAEQSGWESYSAAGEEGDEDEDEEGEREEEEVVGGYFSKGWDSRAVEKEGGECPVAGEAADDGGEGRAMDDDGDVEMTSDAPPALEK